MDKKQFRTDDSGVSPVIGVILMVAITVILAAVIGTFVMDLGQNSASRQASAGVNAAGNDAVTLTSLGEGTDGIKCAGVDNAGDSGSGPDWTANIGEKLTCSSADSVVAYSNSDGVKNASVYTFD